MAMICGLKLLNYKFKVELHFVIFITAFSNSLGLVFDWLVVV
jgi:hypothetical protein